MMYPKQNGGIQMRRRAKMLPMLASIGIGAYAYYQMKKDKTI